MEATNLGSEWMKPVELGSVLLLGLLFGLLLGMGIDEGARTYMIRALALFILVACLAYLLSRRKDL